MSHAEKMRLLNGSLDEKRFLFRSLLDLVASGGTLQPDEVVMLEYLKTLFLGTDNGL